MSRSRSTIAAIVLVLGIVGCEGGSSVAPEEPWDPWIGETPINDTPAHTLVRFEAAYENQVLDVYGWLLTDDFRFEFSPDADPELVLQFGRTWGVRADSTSSAHLFDGFVTGTGDSLAGATRIVMNLSGTTFEADPDHADSTDHYRRATVPTLVLNVEIAGTDGYEIAVPQEFQLVRGDAADLRAGQPATADRWYIRRWIDRSPAPVISTSGTGAAPDVTTTRIVSPGRLKAVYR